MVKTFVIAEAGSTWRIGTKSARHIEYAKKCIRLARQVGANACKFQWCSDPRLMEKRRKVPEGSYTILAWPAAWLNVFAAECEQVGIEFMCTAFLPQDIATIAPFVKRFKVASLEAKDKKFVKACALARKPILISTGTLIQKEVDDLCFDYACILDVPFYLLHCTSSYPAPLEQLNLSSIYADWGDGRSTCCGLSDHSGDTLTGALAVACGAEIVEFHIRLDETRKDNPDYPHSLAPMKAAEYVANIRKAELMMGDGIKKIEQSEIPMLKHRVIA